VHADDFVRPLCPPRDLGDRDRAGVRGENRVRLGDTIEVGEDAVLELAVFGRRFVFEGRM
jgi:hypothetical protein